jgi:hypothetical protein
MEMLLRSLMVRSGPRAGVDTMKPYRSPERGTKVFRGARGMCPPVPRTEPTGLEVWPVRSQSKVAACHVPSIFTKIQQLPFSGPPSLARVRAVGHTLALL